MDCSLPGSSVHGISQARILEWVAISFSRGFSQPRDQTWVSEIAGRCFTVWATREYFIIFSFWRPSFFSGLYFQSVQIAQASNQHRIPMSSSSLIQAPHILMKIITWSSRKNMLYLAFNTLQCSSVQSISHVRLFATPWIAVHQASLSITNSQSLLKPMSIESVMPSSHLILCRPLLLLPRVLPSIRVFSSESALRMRWPKYWSFSFNISPSNEHPGLISFRMDWLNLLVVQGTLKSLSNTTVQKHQFFGAQLSL